MPQSDIRPQFEPLPCDTGSVVTSLKSSSFSHANDTADIWTPIIRCSAPFPIELFESAVVQLVHHPEYNSTLILRSEMLSDVRCFSDCKEDDVGGGNIGPVPCALSGYMPVRLIHRRLLPRRPGRDASLEQMCVLYSITTSAALHKKEDLAARTIEPDTYERDESDTSTQDDKQGTVVSLLVLTPLVKDGEKLPYYHPAVARLAVRYIPVADVQEPGLDTELGTLLIEAVLPAIPSSSSTFIEQPPQPPDPASRLYRTCLSLLDTVHRYGWGALTHYRKRVHHDCLVPREDYQDLYLILREKYKHLINAWKEATDPLKHVFEDVGIATFLMLFWKATCGNGDYMPARESTDAPWRSWPRPAGGFLDLGCGNGLLTHILVSEGYAGHGIDVRLRQSWSHYPDHTRKALHVYALDPTCCPIDTRATELENAIGDMPTTTKYDLHPPINNAGTEFLKPDVFLIGNHADELTPWIPVLATLCDAAGYLSIPCCAWKFDERFTRTSSTSFLPPSGTVIGPNEDEDAFIEMLNLGAEGSRKSQYSAYRIWLAQLSRWMGWKVECEVLRIPSTRNWGIVGRERLFLEGDGKMEVYKDRARAIVNEVVRRGMFKTRKPEGKADH